MTRLRGNRFVVFVLRTWVLLCPLGCDWSSDSVRQSAVDSAGREDNEVANGPGVVESPRLMVVGAPELAAVLEREWLAKTRQPLRCKQVSEEAFRAQWEQESTLRLAADVLVIPRRYLGHLAESDAIVAAPSYVRDSGFARGDLAESDFFPLIRQQEMRWGGRIVALPFGTVPLLMAYRQDVFEKYGLEPPRRWSDLSGVVRILAEKLRAEQSDLAPILQPLAPDWAAITLLARSASYVRDPRRYSDVFELGTMRPLLADPPFVRALEELVEDQAALKESAVGFDPFGTFAAVRDGSAAIGVACCPLSPSATNAPLDVDGWDHIGITSLPGSTEVFAFGDSEWETLSVSRQVSVLGAAGHVGVVVRGTKRQRAAWSLLARLTGKSWGGLIIAESRAGLPSRVSQLALLPEWYGSQIEQPSMVPLRSALEAAYSQPLTLPILRIPFAWEYLAVLDEQVIAAANRKTPPSVALANVVSEWNRLLDKHDRQKQATAYLRQLQIEDWGF